MATIEPRLIHLLNDDPTSPELPNTDLLPLPSLPTLQLPPLSGARDGPLPPLQLEGLRADRFFGSAGRNAAVPGPSSGAPLASPFIGDQSNAYSDYRRDNDFSKEGKYAGSSALYPLRLLLSEVNMPLIPTPPAPSFTSILNEGPDFQDDAPSSTSNSTSTSTSANTTTTTDTATSTSTSASTSTSSDSSSSSASSSSSSSSSSNTTAATAEDPPSSANKKRPAIHIKDDFVQLPQPTKKPKAHQAPFMPPIINGLLEPPPHVALFPPIESSAFDDTDAGQSKLLHELSYSPPGPRLSPEPDQPVAKPRATRKRSSKPRRKWTEEETNHLLKGVDRHGVGKWTNILDDPDYTFNSRSAGDLKDRFRTCCPEEMRVKEVDEVKARARRRQLRSKPRPKSLSPKKSPGKTVQETQETLLAEGGSLSGKDPAASIPFEFDDMPIKRSRAHRMKVSDLAGLGITGPFRRARRRERTAFSNRDDQEILQGLEKYGASWSKIQRDERFHLGTRQPTDLRDRVRNKFPYIFQRIEKGVFQPKDVSITNILEPMVSTSIVGSFKSAPAPPLTLKGNPAKASQEELPKWPFLTAGSTEQLQQPTRDTDESAASAAGGEMDISRLLLDDAQLTPALS
ncbi:Myb-DNA binding domain protein [Trichoderma guizhouense]|uniref:Myb-DNA binding domain protein n=1 Tax=Trichoderma guizhouense TaxID=1491466 RepID=A0A1T3CBN3_9HYPO|nr:Myb-DNA binding domain protein [Trichoderma guizhouense]